MKVQRTVNACIRWLNRFYDEDAEHLSRAELQRMAAARLARHGPGANRTPRQAPIDTHVRRGEEK